MLLKKILPQVNQACIYHRKGSLVLVELSFRFEEKAFGFGQTLFQVISDPQGACSIFTYLIT